MGIAHNEADDPVVQSYEILVAGVQMLVQTTQGGRTLLNGAVVEPDRECGSMVAGPTATEERPVP